MAFAPDQVSTLVVWGMSIAAAALLTGLIALVAASRTAAVGGGPLVRFMASNAMWSLGIATVMVPMEPLARALVFHWIWLGAALTSALWIRAVLAHVQRTHRVLMTLSNVALGLAAFIALDAVTTVMGFSLLTEQEPIEEPGFMVRAAGNQVSFLPAAVVVGAVWGLLVVIAAVLLWRLVRQSARHERLLLAGIAITGVVSVLDGVTATLADAVALAFAANLVEAVVLTSAQVRRVSTRLAEVERASREQQARLGAQLEQLRDMQRLSVLGAQTARITHDIRNPLMVVAAGVDLLHQKLLENGGSDDEIDELTELTHRALERTIDLASGVTRTVRHADEDEVFDVGRSVDDALLLSAHHLDGVDVRVERSEANVVGRPAELTQVLVNLLQNASEAIDGEDARWVQIAVGRDSRRVHIDVADAGARPSDDVVRRMFRTPFTTKGEGGTGLGLEICAHIIDSMDGTIFVEPAAAHTTVRIELPRADRAAA